MSRSKAVTTLNPELVNIVREHDRAIAEGQLIALTHVREIIKRTQDLDAVDYIVECLQVALTKQIMAPVERNPDAKVHPECH